MPGDPLRLYRGQRLARLRKQVPHHERRVTHHVVEHSTALQPAPPEPWRMRAAVLLRGAREVRPAGELGAPGPEQRAAHFHLWRKELVLEIARPESRPTRQPRHRLRLGDIPCQRLLTCQPDQLAPAALDGIDDLLDVLDARMIGTAEPNGVNVGIGHHRFDRLVRRGVAQVELTSHPRRGCGVARVRAPDAQHIAIAHLLKGAQVKLRVETAADDPDSQSLGSLHLRPPYFRSHCS